MERDMKIYLGVGVIIIFIIAGIFYFKDRFAENPQEDLMRCIASKAVLYSSKTCGHCKTQKEILGNYISLFRQVDCFDNPNECNKANIGAYPTWIIDGKHYQGVKSIEELKELTGCECTEEIIETTENSGNCEVSETCIEPLTKTTCVAE